MLEVVAKLTLAEPHQHKVSKSDVILFLNAVTAAPVIAQIAEKDNPLTPRNMLRALNFNTSFHRLWYTLKNVEYLGQSGWNPSIKKCLLQDYISNVMSYNSYVQLKHDTATAPKRLLVDVLCVYKSWTVPGGKNFVSFFSSG